MNNILKRVFVICVVEIRAFLGTLRFHGKNTIDGDKTLRHHRTSVGGGMFARNISTKTAHMESDQPSKNNSLRAGTL